MGKCVSYDFRSLQFYLTILVKRIGSVEWSSLLLLILVDESLSWHSQ